MSGFCDSDKFAFIEVDVDGKKHNIPVHHRELGEKDGLFYSGDVSWSDVVINDVPLEKTFEFEDNVPIYEEKSNYSEGGIIFINERQTPLTFSGGCEGDEEDYSIHQNKKWMNRLSRVTLGPITLPEAKKKRKSVERYPVKPKHKKVVRDEKINTSSEKFGEFIDERDTEYMSHFFEHINRGGESQENPIYIPSLNCSPESGWPVGWTTFSKKILTPYYPPIHWTEPTIQWSAIWSHMDEIVTGKKREYHYIKEGELDGEGYPGPAIFFYDKDSDDLNYNFNWVTDYRCSCPYNHWVSYNPS
jgi:hypothetical protein